MSFNVQMPDGTVIEDVPEGTTQEQILARYNAMTAGANQQPAAQQQPAQAPQKRSIPDEIARQIGLTGRAAYEAFTSPATAVLEAGRTAYNLGAQALGAESRIPSFYTEQSKALTAAGVPEPSSTLERAVNLGTQSMVSTAATAKALPKVAAFAEDLVRQIPASGIAGLVSQPVAEIVKDITGSDLAAIIASTATGAGGAAATGKAISAAQQAKTPLYTMAEVKQRASRAYNVMDESGVVLKPESTTKMITDVRQSLADARMIPNSDAAKTINNTLDDITNMVNKEGVSFTTLEKMREKVNDLKMSSDGNIKRLGGVAISKIDDFISNLNGRDLIAGKEGIDKAVKNVIAARKDWRNASRASILDDALNVAEAKALDPKASESELIRRGFINIVADKNKMKAFTENEQNLIKSVAKGGSLDPLLSVLSRFSPLRSQLVTAGAIPAYSQLPTTTMAVLGGGLLADVAQGALRSRAANQAVKQIASGATPAQQPSLAYRGLLSSPAIDLESLKEPR
jgi:hypothetical protein